MTKVHNFLHSGVKNLNTCVLDFYVVSVVWSEFMALLWFLIFGLVQVLYLSLVVNF